MCTHIWRFPKKQRKKSKKSLCYNGIMPKLLVANWKLNPTSIKEAEKLFLSASRVTKSKKNAEIVVCPPAPFLDRLNNLNIALKVKLGAQDCFYEKKGAYTGEISAPMLKKLSVSHVIIGHSERRKYQQETDEIINKKIKSALRNNLKVILCVGEPFAVRKKGFTAVKSFIKSQLVSGLKNISNLQPPTSNLLIAYEPIWAIGTGRAAKPKDAVAMAKFVKKILMAKPYTLNPSVLYGGSTNSENLESFIKHKEIYGALVGGASIKAEEFKKMIKITEKYS